MTSDTTMQGNALRVFVVLTLFALGTYIVGPASARPFDIDQSLEDFLAGCSTDTDFCYARLNNDLDKQTAAELACPPESLTNEAAGMASLNWLRNAVATDNTLLKEKVVDVDFGAFATLWPCPN